MYICTEIPYNRQGYGVKMRADGISIFKTQKQKHHFGETETTSLKGCQEAMGGGFCA